MTREIRERGSGSAWMTRCSKNIAPVELKCAIPLPITSGRTKCRWKTWTEMSCALDQSRERTNPSANGSICMEVAGTWSETNGYARRSEEYNLRVLQVYRCPSLRFGGFHFPAVIFSTNPE